MKMKKTIIVVVCIVALVISSVCIVIAGTERLAYYNEEKIVAVSLCDTRTCFITESGAVYIAGRYFNESDVGMGLSPFNMFCFGKRSLIGKDVPVRIFENGAAWAELSSVGGVIVDNEHNLFFFDTDRKTRKPTLLCGECKQAVMFGDDVFYINRENELISINTRDGAPGKTVLRNVSDVKSDADGSLCLLRGTGDALYLQSYHDAADESKYIVLATQAKAFDYSSNGAEFCLAYITADGYAYTVRSGGDSPKLICELASKVAVSREGVLVLTQSGKAVYHGKDMSLGSDKYYELFVLSDNATLIAADQKSICITENDSSVLFWGLARYGSFGKESVSGVYEIYKKPFVFTRRGQGTVRNH